MDKKNVLVLFGGVSPEHEISKISADNIIKHLSEEKYHVIPVYITKEGKWLLYDGTIDQIKNIAWEKFGTPAVLSPDRVNRGLLRIVGDKVKTIPVDVVFPILHGENGEDGTIQGLCALAGIPCVGCGVLTSAICMDKAFMRVIANQIGLPQTKYLVFSGHELEEINEVTKKIRYQIGYPCFIKPSFAGSSIGITKATNKKEVVEGLKIAASVSDNVMVEKAIVGREIECGVIGTNGNIKVSLPGEILPAAEFYDYEAKYHSTESKTIVPAVISEEEALLAQQMSAAIFKAVDGSGLARVDFFLSEDPESGKNQVIFNEINTMPGFTGISLFPMAWETSGIPLTDLLDILIEMVV